MIKKITISLFLSLFYFASFSQYAQETRILASSPSQHDYDWTVGRSYNFDESGRAYFAINTRNCCLAAQPNATFLRYDFGLNQFKGYGEVTGAEILTFPGHYNNFYGIDPAYQALRKMPNGWNVSLSIYSGINFKYVEEDYFQNVYVLQVDSLKKFDSTGTMLWEKSGGGNLIRADLSGNYYISTNSTISKYDPNGNLIRTMAYPVTHFVISKSCFLYIASSSSITKLDSAGNMVYQYPAAAGKLAVDKNENVYFFGNGISKLDSTGTTIAWTRSFSYGSLKSIGVDSMFNCYILGTLSAGFVPPNNYNIYNTVASNSYYLFITKISSQVTSDTVTTYPVSPVKHSVCAGDSITIQVKFFMQQSLMPFRVELSDSTGSFASPLLLGTGSTNNIKVFVPASIPSAFGYRIRVTTTTGNPIVIPNPDGPFKINVLPPAQITVTNYYSYSNLTYYGCSGNLMNLNSNTDPAFAYQWYKADWIGGPGGYYSYTLISGQTDSIYNPASGYFGFSVRTTNTITGCAKYAPVVNIGYSNPIPATITNLPASVCLNQPPITLTGSPWGGTFSGNGMYYNIFYPDSAGAGTHTITYTYNSPGCGLTDTTVAVTVNPVPVASITANSPLTFCQGDSVVLNAFYHINRTYQWKKDTIDMPGAVLSSYTAFSSGTYKVTVTNTITGCSKTTSQGKTVTVNPKPVASVTPQGPTTFCAGDSVILSANSGSGLIYQWKKNGVAITGANSINYTATTAGVYKVQNTNGFGCKRTSGGITVSVPCIDNDGGSGRMQSDDLNFQVFPNPASARFTIRSAEKIFEIIITSLSGQTVFKKEFENNFTSEVEMDVSNQSTGIYLIQVITEKKVCNQKIILN